MKMILTVAVTTTHRFLLHSHRFHLIPTTPSNRINSKGNEGICPQGWSGQIDGTIEWETKREDGAIDNFLHILNMYDTCLNQTFIVQIISTFLDTFLMYPRSKTRIYTIQRSLPAKLDNWSILAIGRSQLAWSPRIGKGYSRGRAIGWDGGRGKGKRSLNSACHHSCRMST